MKSECARHFMTYDDKNTFSISSSQTVNRATKCPLKLVVFSIFKKSNHYVPCYWLKLQLLLNFAKVAFFDHHTSTYLLSFPHFEEEKRKNKDIDDCFYEYASASGNKRWSFDEIFYGLITTYFPNTFFKVNKMGKLLVCF